MSPHIIEIPYHPYTILNIFAKISHIEWSILLYSGHNNKHPDSRFDILVTNPILKLITKNNITKVYYNNIYHIKKTNPFTLLKRYMHNSRMQASYDHNFPFQGGLLGIFGYDLVRHIESLPTLAQNDLSFPDMAVGLYRWTIITDHKFCKSYIISHDDPNKILSWIKIQQYNKNHVHQKTKFKLLKPWKSNINKSEYFKKFEIIKKNLVEGNCYQVCLSQRFHAPYIGNEWKIFHYLLNYNHAPFSAFACLPNQLNILSLSPERFLQLRNKQIIRTQPIKGTLPRLKNIYKDLLQIKKLSQSVKNQSENLMIVDLLRNDIGKVSIPGSIQVSKLFEIQSFPKIHHMVSTIIGKLHHNFSAYDLLQSCFPGGSITGAPKIQAMKLIEQLEPHRRSIWSGSIGYFSCCGNMDTNISIRTLLTNNKYLFCSVGSGIVYDSNADDEYQEMQDKLSTLLTPLLNYIN